MPGILGITSVAEMRSRRIAREEKEAREEGRKRAKTPRPITPTKPKTPDPEAFRKRFLLADAKGRFRGIVQAASKKVPTGLLAQEARAPTPPAIHLPRISHSGAAFGHPAQLVEQLGSEARASLEALEVAELFTGIEATQTNRMSHMFVHTWSEDALRAQGLEAPPAIPKDEVRADPRQLRLKEKVSPLGVLFTKWSGAGEGQKGGKRASSVDFKEFTDMLKALKLMKVGGGLAGGEQISSHDARTIFLQANRRASTASSSSSVVGGGERARGGDETVGDGDTREMDWAEFEFALTRICERCRVTPESLVSDEDYKEFGEAALRRQERVGRPATTHTHKSSSSRGGSSASDARVGAQRLGVLTVRVEGAENLLAADAGGTSDPFCELCLCSHGRGRSRGKRPPGGSQKVGVTRVVEKSRNPVWEAEDFIFDVWSLSDRLELKVFDHDGQGAVHDFLGGKTVPMRELCARGQRKTFKVRGITSDHHEYGEMVVDAGDLRLGRGEVSFTRTDTLTLEGANGSAFVDAAASIRVSGVVTLTFTYEPVLSQPSPPSTSASSRSQGTLALGYSGALSGHVAGNSGPHGAVTARDSLAQDFSHKTGGETKAAPLLAYMKELSRRELAGLDGEFARLMAHADGALTARARLEAYTTERALAKTATRAGRAAAARLAGQRQVDEDVKELQNLTRATVALEEAVHEDRRKDEEQREKARLKRIRLRQEWAQYRELEQQYGGGALTALGGGEYARVAMRLQDLAADREKKLQLRATQAKRKLQVQLSWCRLGFTHVRRVSAACALRLDCVNAALAAIFAGVDAHVERAWREDVARRQHARHLLRKQMELRDKDYAHARLFQAAAALQRAFQAHAARARMRARRVASRQALGDLDATLAAARAPPAHATPLPLTPSFGAGPNQPFEP